MKSYNKCSLLANICISVKCDLNNMHLNVKEFNVCISATKEILFECNCLKN
jgi:hypothetical protein